MRPLNKNKKKEKFLNFVQRERHAAVYQTRSNMAFLTTKQSLIITALKKKVVSGFIPPLSCGTDPYPDPQHYLKKVKVGKYLGGEAKGGYDVGGD
jgi:hypothetical protein